MTGTLYAPAQCALPADVPCGEAITDECANDCGTTGEGCEGTAYCTDSGCTFCGNEVLDPGEVCDDGNTEDGDLCSADCTRAKSQGRAATG